jgi:hypothetical protein
MRRVQRIKLAVLLVVNMLPLLTVAELRSTLHSGSYYAPHSNDSDDRAVLSLAAVLMSLKGLVSLVRMVP